jgi:protein TonB
MRTYSFVVSTVVHAALLVLAFVMSAVATGALPIPRYATEFIVVAPAPPPEVPPPAPPAPTQAAAPSHAASVSEPNGIPPPVAPSADLPLVGPSIVPGFATDAIPDGSAPPPGTRGPGVPVRVGGTIQAPRKLVHVVPEYPAIARASRVQGVIILEAVIADDGSVDDVRVLRSIPLLDSAAIDAVRQWRFTPTLLNGEPVAVVTTVTVAFSLN